MRAGRQGTLKALFKIHAPLIGQAARRLAIRTLSAAANVSEMGGFVCKSVCSKAKNGGKKSANP